MTERPALHAVYVISVFAELAGVHPQTLRNYERNGLLRPKRTSGGSRRFSDEDLVALRRIQDLTNEGVNLEGVKRIMALETKLETLKSQLNEQATRARDDLEAAHRQYRRDLVPVQNALAVVVDAKRRARKER
ncbi:MAG: transcriptional regulator, MerR family [Acidimicrobiaceae bacterium]|nr:transcriptional regulator, MerR family [Acidimicrobiaceae bacterium]